MSSKPANREEEEESSGDWEAADRLPAQGWACLGADEELLSTNRAWGFTEGKGLVP